MKIPSHSSHLPHRNNSPHFGSNEHHETNPYLNPGVAQPGRAVEYHPVCRFLVRSDFAQSRQLIQESRRRWEAVRHTIPENPAWKDLEALDAQIRERLDLQNTLDSDKVHHNEQHDLRVLIAEIGHSIDESLAHSPYPGQWAHALKDVPSEQLVKGFRDYLEKRTSEKASILTDLLAYRVAQALREHVVQDRIDRDNLEWFMRDMGDRLPGFGPNWQWRVSAEDLRPGVQSLPSIAGFESVDSSF